MILLLTVPLVTFRTSCVGPLNRLATHDGMTNLNCLKYETWFTEFGAWLGLFSFRKSNQSNGSIACDLDSVLQPPESGSHVIGFNCFRSVALIVASWLKSENEAKVMKNINHRVAQSSPYCFFPLLMKSSGVLLHLQCSNER